MDNASTPPLICSVADGRARLVLNRPEFHNALNPALMSALKEALSAAAEDPSVRVVTLEGAGKSFCAGADLKALLPLLEDQAALRAYIGEMAELCTLMESMAKPVVAVVHGFVLAGGLELLLACDLAIAAEDATLGDQHINFGLIPGGGATQRLPRVIGPRLAKELMLTGSRIDGRRAEALGLVNRAVPAASLEESAAEWVAGMARNSPAGMGRIKELAALAIDSPLEEGIQAEVEAFLQYAQHPDFREGLQAFQEKRPPKYQEA